MGCQLADGDAAVLLVWTVDPVPCAGSTVSCCEHACDVKMLFTLVDFSALLPSSSVFPFW